MKSIDSITGILKKLVVGAGLTFCCIFGASAQSFVATNAAPGITNNFLTGNYLINSISISAGTLTSPQVINFYDSGTTNISYATTNTWYSRVTTNAFIYSVLTNALGTVYTNVYPGQWTSIVTNGPSTNTLPVIAALAVSSGGSVSITRNSLSGANITTINGLTAVYPAGASNLSLVISYNTNGL